MSFPMPTADLPGPSRTIEVDPIEEPMRQPREVPAPAQPEKEPVKEPAPREPVPA